MEDTTLIESKIAEANTIGEKEVLTASDTLSRYKQGKANLDARIIANEDWWKLQHRRYFKNDWKEHEIYSKPTSAYLFNSLMNKHADVMDNYPSPCVLPRERSDEGVAKTLASIIPVILDRGDFEQVYSHNAWDKLKNGCSIYSVVWDSAANNGIGDIVVKPVDLLTFYCEPGVQDIQDSRDIFIETLVDRDSLVAQYPDLEGKIVYNAGEVHKYNYDDTVNTEDKVCVVDWYYKVTRGSKTTVQYCKYVGKEVLFASENDPTMREEGFYKHGKYPFVVDVLFEEKGTPFGFGFIDVMKSPQEYIDRLGGALLDNSLWIAKPRWFVKDACEIHEEEYLDTTKPFVHVAGSPNDDNLKQVRVDTITGTYLSILEQKINELKETSGNRDFSQGATTAGVTAASAISILTENGSKGSRDLIKGCYRAFKQICNIVIELIRQFYDIQRTFRIIGEGNTPEFIEFDNSGMVSHSVVEFGQEFASKEPVFDVDVKAQKANPYAQISQNELGLQFYNLGFFNPQMSDQALATIDMMEFEGKEKVRETIRNNGTLFDQLQRMTQALQEAGQVIAQTTGDTRVMEAAGQQLGQKTPVRGGSSTIKERDEFGNAEPTGNSTAEKAKRMAQHSTDIK